VVFGWVDGVDTDGVGLHLLEVFNVALAGRRVSKRIGNLDSAVGRLCGVGVDFLCET
jgi:hypothetical protein